MLLTSRPSSLHADYCTSPYEHHDASISRLRARPILARNVTTRIRSISASERRDQSLLRRALCNVLDALDKTANEGRSVDSAGQHVFPTAVLESCGRVTGAATNASGVSDACVCDGHACTSPALVLGNGATGTAREADGSAVVVE